MTISIVAREEFEQELDLLRSRFDNMKPELEVTVRDSLMDVEGYVVVWNTAISRAGPLHNIGKGGTRVTNDLSLQQVKRLARAMAKKNAAAGLPLGGAKSGLRLDPAEPGYEQKYRRFVELCAPLLHENGGIFGGFGYDVGGIPPLNAIWACDQLKSTRSFTGKPVEMGGTNYDVEGIAGLGVAVAAATLLEDRGENVVGKTFSVQGAGAMGAAVIRYFASYGAELKSVSDPKYGGTWKVPGRPTDALVAALSERRTEDVLRLLSAEATLISSDPSAALSAEVDVLFPCAMEDAIREDNAGSVHARIISEGANNSITEAAHRILFEKGVKVVPDIIANSGGIIAAFVELTFPAENPAEKGHGRVVEAKRITTTRISANVRRLNALTEGLGVQPDRAADFLAYRSIFDAPASAF